MSERKVVDDRYYLPAKRGNGQLRREIWVDETGRVSRYNLAYINHSIYPHDNGRVVGYDNHHGYHHRHYFGQSEPIEFISFADIEARFEEDWIVFRR